MSARITFVRHTHLSEVGACGCGYAVSVTGRKWMHCDRKGHKRRAKKRATEAFNAFDASRPTPEVDSAP